ncbi:MAG TPA: helix-turn-helix transcriptional regulator [Gemmataceae bacterium]|jgi:transcriptional regulator with XRE-family HTH domain|nr:helix-turn-helix transcriptional regulator [Gemmataceae bacterium]
MAKKQPGKPETTLRGFFEFAIKLWKDGSRLKGIREKLGLSKKEFAKRAGISVQKLNGYERSGQMAGNFWLFCGHLEEVVIRDPDDWEKYLEDPDDSMRGGKRNKRDKRYGKPDKFWRWAEDAKKDEMSRRTGKEPPRGDVEGWYKEWEKLGKPDGWGREESKPME